MVWKLIIEDDEGHQTVVPLSRDVITIGRKEGNTIRLTERNVSRFHAKLLRAGPGIAIEDLRSSNGTRINGERIAGQVDVKQGDLIEIGDYHLAVQSDQPQPEAPSGTLPQFASTADALMGPTGSDDEFEGDTMRWEAPAAMQAPSIEAPTVQDQAPVLPRPDPLLGAATERLPAADTMQGLAAVTSEAPGMPDPRQGLMADATVPIPQAPLHTPSAPPMADRVSDTLPSPGISMADLPQAAPTELTAPLPATEIDGQHEGPRLVATSTDLAGEVFRLAQGKHAIGRVPDNAVVVSHASVSRHHATVEVAGDQVRIHDSGSVNGILVNGTEVSAAVLKSGDVVELGRVLLRFVPPGETFTLSPAAIEAARSAEAAHATQAAPAAPGGAPLPPAAKGGSSKAVMIAGGAVVLVGLLAAAFFLGRGSHGDPTPAPAPAPAPVAPTPAAAAPVDPAALKKADALAKAGKHAAAVAAYDALLAGGTNPAVQAKRDASQAALDAKKTEDEMAKALGKNQAQRVLDLAAQLPEPLSRRAQSLLNKAEAARAGELFGRTRAALRGKDLETAGQHLGDLEALEGETARVKSLKNQLKAATEATKVKTRNAPVRPSQAANVASLQERANRALFNGQTRSARRLLLDALKLDGRNTGTHKSLGIVYARMKDYSKSAYHYRQYLKLAPDAPDRRNIEKMLRDMPGR